MSRPEPQDLPPWTRTLLPSPGFRLLSYRVEDAVDLDAGAFQAACRRLYHRLWSDLGNELDAGAPAHPVRLWNFIPGILEPLGDLPHRYMVFNAGRFEALSALLGGDEGIDRSVVTASGVGHGGRDLLVHCLAAEAPGRPVENPRQVSSYRYSRRFGPTPPCFARATRFRPVDEEAPWLLVGGTASVVGEESAHETSLDDQLAETLHNLAAVVEAAGAGGDPLAAYRHLRIYFVRPEDRDHLASRLRERLGEAAELELVRADLCRPELLVEIEGLADLAEAPRRELLPVAELSEAS